MAREGPQGSIESTSSAFVEVGVFVQDSGVHGYKARRAKGFFPSMFVDSSGLVLRWTFGVVGGGVRSWFGVRWSLRMGADLRREAQSDVSGFWKVLTLPR